MITKTLFFLLALSGILTNIYSIEVNEDDQNIYTSRNWNELSDNIQRDLMVYFSDKIEDKLKKEFTSMDFFSVWCEKTKELLIGTEDLYEKFSSTIKTQASSYGLTRNISLDDLIPTGFMIGIGVNGGGALTVGLGATALITLTVVPVEVEVRNKVTNQISTHYKVSWTVGGLGQGNFGIGGGAGIAAHGAIGIIWGDLPNANALNGWAEGISGNIDHNYGIGFKVAVLENSTTHFLNLVALLTFDMGVQEGGEIYASGFYFMSANEVIDYLTKSLFGKFKGEDIINKDDLATS